MAVALVSRPRFSIGARTLLLVAAFAACADQDVPTVSPSEELRPSLAVESSSGAKRKADVGEAIFFDRALSLGGNQSCASCHEPRFGFTSPNLQINAHGSVLEGSVSGRFAIRKTPSAAYATFSPRLEYLPEDDAFVGGLFWDGRADGRLTGSPAADQALEPFLGRDEQALADKACVVYRVAVAKYAANFKLAWGNGVASIAFPSNTAALCQREGITVPLSQADRRTVDAEYIHVARSIAAFEASSKVNAFSSKYDRYLSAQATLTEIEQRGLALFEGKALCSACHPNAGQQALFTDFTYDNIGTPVNTENPAFISRGFVDLGLGGFLNRGDLHGAQKVPTLRNIDKRITPFDAKSYMHNGAFKTLEQVVHFYNTRDVLPQCVGVVLPIDPRFGRDCWPAPEVAANVNEVELGDLGLTPREEKAVVAYLRTLTDR